MNNLFLHVFSLSIICSFVILCVIFLNKIFWKNYSRQWKYIIWVVIAIRLIVPINISVIDIQEIFHEREIAGKLNPYGESLNNTNEIEFNDSILADNMNQIESNDSILPKNKNKIESNDSISAKNTQTSSDSIDRKGTLNAVETKIQQAMRPGENMEPIFQYVKLNHLTTLWIVGVILYLSYHLLVYLNYQRKIIRWSIVVKNKNVLQEYHKVCKELNIKHPIHLVTCKQVNSPILIGFTKPCIVLPAKEFTLEEYNYILKHELIHYKHHDLFYKLILLFASAIHWFNPLVHHMVNTANHDIELYCDEKLVAKNSLSYREKYSNMLLRIMTDSMKNDNILLSTGFRSKNKQLKNRFFQIMNSKPTKKGTCFIISLICVIILAGNLIVSFIPTKISSAKITDEQSSGLLNLTNSNDTKDVFNNPVTSTSVQLEEVNNILVVGIDGKNSEDISRADSIIVISVNPITKKVYFTSFLRDMYVEIPDHGRNKLSKVYELGGISLMKDTIETNFKLNIDHMMTVNMQAFERIIDSIGGIELDLSEQEADYLNKTNYISDKKYRNVVAGKQILNGNQALGFVRVRKVPTIQGEMDDLGRTTRLRRLLSTLFKESSKKDINELMKSILTFVPYVSTDLSLDQMLIYLNTVMQEGVDTNSISIPTEGSYTQTVRDGMNVLDLNLEENIEVLKQIYH